MKSINKLEREKKITTFLKSKTLYFHNFILSKAPLNSSKYAYIPMDFIKLEWDLQPSLGSLGQFLFKNSNRLNCPIVNDISLD